MGCYGMQVSNYAAGDYYRGDYYRGDYYRGDPFIGGLLKKVGGAIGKVAKAALPFVPVIGPAAKAASSLLPTLFQGGRMDQPPPQLPVPPGFQSPFLGPQVFQARGALYCPPPGMPGMPAMKIGRLNKSTYVTRGGGTSRWPPTLLVHQRGTECVARRRMNVANPRALRRALRRAQGFAKLARRFVAVSRKFKKGKRRKR